VTIYERNGSLASAYSPRGVSARGSQHLLPGHVTDVEVVEGDVPLGEEVSLSVATPGFDGQDRLGSEPVRQQTPVLCASDIVGGE
jgi:hypothetical protein